MPGAKQKQIRLDVVVLPKVHNLSVSMTIPFWCARECIALLWGNNPCENDEGQLNKSLHKGSEEAAIAFALFTLIREKLMGSPLEMARSKVDHVACSAQANNFVVAWNTQGTGSALRKTIGVALKSLQPNALFSRYGHNMRVLGGKVDRGEFNYIANKMIEAINKSVHFVVVGKIKPDTDWDDLLSTAANKYVSSSKSSASETAALERHAEHKIQYPQIACSSDGAAIVVADYIYHQGFGIALCGRIITVFTRSWESKRDALKKKDRIKGYVAAKYNKLGPMAALYLAYKANSTAQGSGPAILEISKKIDAAGIIAANLK